MKILFLAPDHLPYKTGNGVAVHMYGIIRSLQLAGACITVLPIGFGLDESKHGNQVTHLESIQVKVVKRNEYSQRPSAAGFGLVRSAFWPREKDFFVLAEDNQNLLAKLVAHEKFAAIATYDWSTLFGGNFNAGVKKLAFLVDLIEEYVELQRQSKPTFSLRYRFRDYLRRRPTPSKIRWCYERLNSFDAVIESAVHHAKTLRNRGVKNVHHIPHPMVPPERFVPYHPQPGKTLSILIPGSLKGIASKKGFEFFLDEILPRFDKRRKDLLTEYRFRIVGHGEMDSKLRGRLCERPDVDFVGFVEDIESEYRNADIVLVNIPIPHGYRTRIAEVFGQGRCVVAHSANCAGMPEIVHNRNALTSANAEGMVKNLILAINDGKLRVLISQNARKSFDESYSYLAMKDRFCALLAENPGQVQ